MTAKAPKSLATVCCGCAQQCGIVVDVEDNRVLDIHGDPEHPISQGFICPKGRDAKELVTHPSRILTPLKRMGPRGAGRWTPISWDAALDEIAARLAHIKAKHGARALAHSYGTFRGGDWGIGERFMNRFGSANSCGQDKICYGPLALGETLTYGMGPTVFSAPVPGVTKTIVLWGMRPGASAPLLWKSIVAAQHAGARLIVIDPVRTREARHADLWLPVKPGRDVHLALALLHEVIVSGRYAQDFVREQCIGFEALEATVRAHDVHQLAAECGVSRAQIASAATQITDHSPCVFNAGNGLCQSGTAALQLSRAVACLVALTGSLGVPGGHHLAGPPRDIRANGSMFDSSLLPQVARAERLGAERYPWLGSGYAAADRAIAQAWYGQTDTMSWYQTAHEPSLWRAITEAQPYPVKALIVQNHNPLGANPSQAEVTAALRSDALELCVVHELLMTSTAALADYVLPAAHWLEKPYFSTGLGFMGAFGDYVGGDYAVLRPCGEVRTDYEFWRDLGRRLGQADAWPDRAEEFYESCLAPSGLKFADVAKQRGPLFGAAARHPNSPVAPPAFGTPSGKVELASSLLEAWGLPATPTPVLAPIQAASAEFPLTLTTGGRHIEGFHQNAQNTARFRRRHPHPLVSMHPSTAAAVGIVDRAWCTITTAIGSVHQQVDFDLDVPPGLVVADRWWYPEGVSDTSDPYGAAATNINMCTSGRAVDCDPVMGTWLMRGLPCRIEPYLSTGDTNAA